MCFVTALYCLQVFFFSLSASCFQLLNFWFKWVIFSNKSVRVDFVCIRLLFCFVTLADKLFLKVCARIFWFTESILMLIKVWFEVVKDGKFLSESDDGVSEMFNLVLMFFDLELMFGWWIFTFRAFCSCLLHLSKDYL